MGKTFPAELLQTLTFCDHDATVSTDCYSVTLDHRKEAIQRKCLGFLIENVTLLHDRAHAHTSGVTVQLWNSFTDNVLPSNFHLYGPLKKLFEGKRFQRDDEVEIEVHQWVQTLSLDLFFAVNEQVVYHRHMPQ
jgi:hypothetical protein